MQVTVAEATSPSGQWCTAEYDDSTPIAAEFVDSSQPARAWQPVRVHGQRVHFPRRQGRFIPQHPAPRVAPVPRRRNADPDSIAVALRASVAGFSQRLSSSAAGLVELAPRYANALA